MATRLFSASKYGQQLFATAGSRRLTVGTLGESFGLDDYLGAAIQYAVWRHYHADIVFDHRTYANGGTVFAVGGTTTDGANGLTTQAAQFALRPTDIAFIASGYNDQPSDSADAAAVAATVMGVGGDLFAAGAKYVVVCGMTPRDGFSAVVWATYNQLIRNWCAATQGAFFLDVTRVLMDPQNSGATDLPWKDIGTHAQGTYLSLTGDGTHWSGHAIRLIAPLIADILEKIVGTRGPRQSFNAGNYSPANSPYANILGDAGMCMGTSGLLNSGADSGVAGTSSASRLSIAGNGVTVTPSIVTGDDGERKQRMAVSGTDTSFAYISLACTPTITGVNGGVSTRKLDFEAVIELTGVTGLADIVLRPLASANDSAGSGSQAACQQWPDDTSETLFARTLYPVDVPSGNNPSFTILFLFGDGSSPAGTIDVSRLSACVVEE